MTNEVESYNSSRLDDFESDIFVNVQNIRSRTYNLPNCYVSAKFQHRNSIISCDVSMILKYEKWIWCFSPTSLLASHSLDVRVNPGILELYVLSDISLLVEG